MKNSIKHNLAFSIFLVTVISFVSVYPFKAFSQNQDLLDLNTIQTEYNALKSEGLPNIIPEIDGRRYHGNIPWNEAISSGNLKPWLQYGKHGYEDWVNANNWIFDRAKDSRSITIEDYAQIEKLALKQHYYSAFEKRRINEAVTKGTLSQVDAKMLIDKINNGIEINFSGIDHSTLPGSFRWDPLDEFVHNGEFMLPDGTRYLTEEEIEIARKSKLLKVIKESLIPIGSGRYLGTIEYPRIVDLKRLVESSFEKFNQNIAKSKDLEQKVRVILDLRTELLTIHRSIDGNGRTIRLLTDLLFIRIGLPPPIHLVHQDIFGNPEDIYKKTVIGMNAYLKKRQAYALFKNMKVPRNLFHWSSKDSFEWMLKNRNSQAQVPMQTWSKNSFLTSAVPALKESNLATFAWTNPIMAMYGGEDTEASPIEWYAKPGKAPVLAHYVIKPTAKILKVKTIDSGEVQVEQNEREKKYDLVYHQHLDTERNLVYHEWVIVNPNSVESWTTDPKQISKYIAEAQLKKDYYPLSERHYINRKTSLETKNYVGSILNQFNSFNSKNSMCSRLFAK